MHIRPWTYQVVEQLANDCWATVLVFCLGSNVMVSAITLEAWQVSLTVSNLRIELQQLEKLILPSSQRL